MPSSPALGAGIGLHGATPTGDTLTSCISKLEFSLRCERDERRSEVESRLCVSSDRLTKSVEGVSHSVPPTDRPAARTWRSKFWVGTAGRPTRPADSAAVRPDSGPTDPGEIQAGIPLKLLMTAEPVETASDTAILHLGVVVTRVATAPIDLHERVLSVLRALSTPRTTTRFAAIHGLEIHAGVPLKLLMTACKAPIRT